MSKLPLRVEKLENPTFMFTCLDGPETAPLRLEHLEGHLRHIEKINDGYLVAGPMKGNDDRIVGSFFLISATSKSAAWELMEGDPYISYKMYASDTVKEMVPACGSWMGGVIWDREELINSHRA